MWTDVTGDLHMTRTPVMADKLPPLFLELLGDDFEVLPWETSAGASLSTTSSRLSADPRCAGVGMAELIDAEPTS